MQSAANIPFPTAETVITSGAIDNAIGRGQGHDRRVVEKHVGDTPVSPAAPISPVPVGQVVSETAQVKDTSAGFFQRQMGFDTWEHTREVVKVAPQDAVVTDKLKWPSNNSTAQRTFEIVGNVANGTNVAANPWTVNVSGVPGASKVAAKMEAKMEETDKKLPEALHQAAQTLPR